MCGTKLEHQDNGYNCRDISRGCQNKGKGGRTVTLLKRGWDNSKDNTRQGMLRARRESGYSDPNGTCRPGVKGVQVPACVQLMWRASSCKLLQDRTEDSCRKSFLIMQGRPRHCTKLDRNTIHNHTPIPPSRIAFY